jgi:magnesium transporter
VTEQIEGFHDLLSDVLIVNLTLVSVQQGEQTKKISSWGAILIIPTVIAGIYGMNFENLPELTWGLGYPFALGLMALICGLLYAVFKRAKWM